MRTQKLLENRKEPDLFFSISIISIILILSLIFSFLFRNLTIEEKLFKGGIFTFLTEVGIIYFSFIKYPEYFKNIFSNFSLFFSGFKYYLIIIPIISIVSLIVYAIFEQLHINVEIQKMVSFYLEIKSIKIILFMFFLSCFIAPLTEEIIFRGILYKSLRNNFSFSIAVILSSLVFSLFHNDLFTFAGIFIFGCFLSIIFERHGYLWPSIGLHFFNNFFTNLFVFFIKFHQAGQIL